MPRKDSKSYISILGWFTNTALGRALPAGDWNQSMGERNTLEKYPIKNQNFLFKDSLWTMSPTLFERPCEAMAEKPDSFRGVLTALGFWQIRSMFSTFQNEVVRGSFVLSLSVYWLFPFCPNRCKRCLALLSPSVSHRQFQKRLYEDWIVLSMQISWAAGSDGLQPRYLCTLPCWKPCRHSTKSELTGVKIVTSSKKFRSVEIAGFNSAKFPSVGMARKRTLLNSTSVHIGQSSILLCMSLYALRKSSSVVVSNKANNV